MVRVRLEDMTDEVQRIADAMQAAGCVLERSREYPNRGEVRAMAELRLAHMDARDRFRYSPAPSPLQSYMQER